LAKTYTRISTDVAETRKMAIERTTDESWRFGPDGGLRDTKRKMEVRSSGRSLPWERWCGKKCVSENSAWSIQKVCAKVMFY
jgi:hypothetical protein